MLDTFSDTVYWPQGAATREAGARRPLVVALGASNALHLHAASVQGAHLNLHPVQSPRGITAPESGRGAADGAGRNDKEPRIPIRLLVRPSFTLLYFTLRVLVRITLTLTLTLT